MFYYQIKDCNLEFDFYTIYSKSNKKYNKVNCKINTSKNIKKNYITRQVSNHNHQTLNL